MAFNRQILHHELVDSVYRKTRSDATLPDHRRQHILAACEYCLGIALRKTCDHKGKEKDAETSGRIIQELGRVYKERTPDKMSLIKAAVLFNAAMQRKASNFYDAEQDLRRLCVHILKLAGARDSNAHVLGQAQIAKSELKMLRTMVNDQLSAMRPVTVHDEGQKQARAAEIERLQKDICDGYKDIMKRIIEFSVHALGAPPCGYALVGMGSVAKQEITPYSDFEHLIVLQDGVENQENYQSVLEYFRWVAVVFQVVLVSVGETILPFMDIFALQGWMYDAFTVCGVSPDGFAPQASKNALGRQQGTQAKPWTTELIKPVREMLKYTKPIHDLKNGYHLADMISKTCYVAGDREVYDEFALGVGESVAPTEKFYAEVRANLKTFFVGSSMPFMQLSDLLDIKREIFRVTTLFVSVLGRHRAIRAASSFQIARQLKKMGEISEKFMHDVLYALSVACEARLRVYSRQHAQADRLDHRQRENESTVVDLLGEETAVWYFETAWRLQCHVSRRVVAENLNEDPTMFRTCLYYSLGKWKKALEVCDEVGLLECAPSGLDTMQAHLIGMCYQKLEQYTKAVEYYKAVEEKLKGRASPGLLMTVLEIATCLIHDKRSESSVYLKRASDLYLKLYEDGKAAGMTPLVESMVFAGTDAWRPAHVDAYVESHYTIAERLHQFGLMCNLLGNVTLALFYFQRELNIREGLSADASKDYKVAECCERIGKCFAKSNQLDQAEAFLKRAKTMYEENDFCKGENDIGIYLGNVLALKCDYHGGIECFRKQLDVETKREELNYLNIATCYVGIGASHAGLKRFDESIEGYAKAKEAYSKNENDPRREMDLATCDYFIWEAMRQKMLHESAKEARASAETPPQDLKR